MDDNCGEWVESMGVASGCGEQEVGVVVRRYIDFLIQLIPTPHVSVLFFFAAVYNRANGYVLSVLSIIYIIIIIII